MFTWIYETMEAQTLVTIMLFSYSLFTMSVFFLTSLQGAQVGHS